MICFFIGLWFFDERFNREISIEIGIGILFFIFQIKVLNMKLIFLFFGYDDGRLVCADLYYLFGFVLWIYREVLV